MAKILLVEDDLDLSQMICDLLSGERHVVEPVTEGEDALSRLSHYQYDLVILDWELPGKLSGLHLIENYRRRGGVLPVLMLTGRREPTDKEAGLDAGTDDYLTKPFDNRELSARVRALLRRPPVIQAHLLEANGLQIDEVACRVTKNGKELVIKKQEFNLLLFFVRNPNKVFSAEALLQRLWTRDEEASLEAVRTSIKRLRQSIDDENSDSMIKTLHGIGYRFDAHAE